jgi:hypothetical protein
MNLKESRISILLLFSLSLLLLAFIILFAWGFIYYRNAAQTANKEPVNSSMKDSSNIAAQRLRDSLQRMYSNTVTQLNTQLDIASVSADSIKENIDDKYREFTLIRNEIAELLDKSSTVEQVNNARQKLVLLQQRLDDWRNKYNDVAAENIRLSALLKQLSANTAPARTATAYPAVQRETALQDNDNKRTLAAPSMQVASLQLQAVDEADKTLLSGSMNVTNNIQSNSLVEMYVVILQPDGKLLKQSAWNTGSFETSEGTRIYSCKLRFDCAKGENKSLNFSVPSTQFQKGKYSILVYHNGVMVAKGTKQLS